MDKENLSVSVDPAISFSATSTASPHTTLKAVGLSSVLQDSTSAYMNTSLPPSSPVLVKAPLAEPESSTPFATPEKAPVQLTSPSIPSTAVVSPNTAAREALEWSERVEVLTREDHEAYVQGAKELLDEVVDAAWVVLSERAGGVPGTQRVTAEELEAIRQEAYEQAAQEGEILSMELAGLQSKYDEERGARKKLEGVLIQYEATINRMILDSSANKTNENAKLVGVDAEKRKLEGEYAELHKKFEDLSARYEEQKRLNESFAANEKALKDSLAKANKELKYSEARFNTLKSHAEEKLKAAGAESDRVKEEKNKEVELLKLKLRSTESKVVSLESAVAAKSEENAELTKLCDELVAKMEGV